MGVTIPFGALVLGLVGLVTSLAGARSAPLAAYLALQLVTLPIFRMFDTPAHDGVRLFLPTFFFWAAFAGLGARWVAERAGSVRGRSIRWIALALVGPAWSAWDWTRIHPYELSYYNVGLPKAMDLGFEPTYWYDAVTPRVLDRLNQSLPPGVAIGFPDPLINPETFHVLKELGRLRADVDLEKGPAGGFLWIWLLTHSSKATAFTRLLHACEPWHESGVQGVRLFSVVDERSVAVAFALHALTVIRDGTARWDPRQGAQRPLELFEPVFAMRSADLRRAIERLRTHGGEARRRVGSEPTAVRQLVERWTEQGAVNPNLDRLLRHAPEAVDRAIDILVQRPDDVRTVLLSPGYLRPERFGGYFPTSTALTSAKP
jgi:hypothetical protein